MEKMKMKEIKTKTLKINKGLYFPEDFAKLPEGTFIYISKGIFLNIDEGEEEEDEGEEEEEEEEKEEEKEKNYKYPIKKVKDLLEIWDGPGSSKERKNLILKKYPDINLKSFLSKTNELSRKYGLKRGLKPKKFTRENTLELLRIHHNNPPGKREKIMKEAFPGLNLSSFKSAKSNLILKYDIKPEEFMPEFKPQPTKRKYDRKTSIELLEIWKSNLPREEKVKLMKQILPNINIESFLSGVSVIKRRFQIKPEEITSYEKEHKFYPKENKKIKFRDRETVVKLLKIWYLNIPRGERIKLLNKEGEGPNIKSSFPYLKNKYNIKPEEYKTSESREFTRKYDKQLTIDLLRIWKTAPKDKRKELMKKRYPGLNIKGFISGKSGLMKRLNIKPKDIYEEPETKEPEPATEEPEEEKEEKINLGFRI
jgi:hypothetical protein